MIPSNDPVAVLATLVECADLPIDECAECGQPLDDTHLAPPSSEVERSLLRERISALVPKAAITVSPSTSVGDVLRLMVERRIGCVVVAEGHILTFHLADLHRTFAEGVKRYVLLSSPLPSTLGLSALDSSKGGGGPDRTRTCDPALIKRML